jgi:hypothetical protein
VPDGTAISGLTVKIADDKHAGQAQVFYPTRIVTCISKFQPGLLHNINPDIFSCSIHAHEYSSLFRSQGNLYLFDINIYYIDQQKTYCIYTLTCIAKEVFFEEKIYNL